MGRFVTLQEYFSETEDSGTRDEFSPDDYRYPFFRQSVAAGQQDPVSRWVRYWRHSMLASMTRGTQVMASLLSGREFPDGSCQERSIDAFDESQHVVATLHNKQSEALSSLETVLCEQLPQASTSPRTRSRSAVGMRQCPSASL